LAEKVGAKGTSRRAVVSVESEGKRSGVRAAITETISGRERAFFDSNILLYADDARFESKQKRAFELILQHREQGTAVLSLQVLQEYFSNATRKLVIDPAEARRKVEIYSRFHLVEPRVSDVFEAIDVYRLHRINYWDAMVVHCASKSGCRVLFTEDLQHGQIIDGVRVVNPFL
jgi:predicted nucleic acid-binding protein